MCTRNVNLKWFAVVGMSLNIFAGAFNFLLVAASPYNLLEYYKRNDIGAIDLVLQVASVGAIVVNVTCMYFVDKYGVGYSFLVGLSCGVLGVCLRIPAVYVQSISMDSNYILFLISTILFNAQVSAFNGFQTKLTSVWFAEKDRYLPNTVISMTLSVGVFTTFICSFYILKKDINTGMEIYLWVGTCLEIVSIVWVSYFLFQTRLTGLPEISADQTSLEILEKYRFNRTEKHVTFLKRYLLTIWKEVKVWNSYGILLVILAIVYGAGTTVLSLQPQLVCPWGYSREITYWMSCTSIVLGGVTFAVAAAIISDKFEKSENLLKTFIGTAPVMLIIGGVIIMKKYREWLLITVCFLIGGFIFPILGLAYEMAVECTYPMDTGLSAGLMQVCGNIVTFVVQIIFFKFSTRITDETILSENSCVNNENFQIRNFSIPLWATGGFLGVFSIIFVVVFKCPFKRKNYQKI